MPNKCFSIMPGNRYLFPNIARYPFFFFDYTCLMFTARMKFTDKYLSIFANLNEGGFFLRIQQSTVIH